MVKKQVSKKVIQKLRTKRKISFQPKEKQVEEPEREKFDDDIEEEVEDVEDTGPRADPPFDGVLRKKWFPKGIDYNDIGALVKALMQTLDPDQPFVLKEIFMFLGDLHRCEKIFCVHILNAKFLLVLLSFKNL